MTVLLSLWRTTVRNLMKKKHNSFYYVYKHQPQRCFLSGWIKKNNDFGTYSVVKPGMVSKNPRTVPPQIARPPYSETGEPPLLEFDVPEVKDACAINAMRKSCHLARHILEKIGNEVQMGRTTDELDAIAHKLTVEAGAYPSPLNYRQFPKSVCTSVNNVCCHGIPDNRPLQDGDIINIDVTVYFGGYHGDCSRTFLVGNVDEKGRELVRATELCLEKAILECKPGVSFSKIGHTIETIAAEHGFTVLPAFLGHGIGSYFHGPPEVFHVYNSDSYPMRCGNTFTIEPVLSQGEREVELLEDGWTCVTVDDARTAQTEHTVLITESGVEILTVL